eukprot:m.460953 g.460953  ORF g.460953 m.460953 type:complete len:58 (-) comp22176_c0_seq1:73-246(-)
MCCRGASRSAATKTDYQTPLTPFHEFDFEREFDLSGHKIISAIKAMGSSFQGFRMKK